MEDMGNVVAKTPSNKGDEVIESKSAFTVVKGEEAPKIGDVAPVSGVAKKQCNMISVCVYNYICKYSYCVVQGETF